jgi:hypothetical protein
MIFPPPLELSLLGLYDAGDPGKERIVLRPTESVNLAQFGILLGYKTENGSIVPLNDHFFWFCEIVVPTPSWIVVFTGEGTFDVIPHAQSGQPVYVFYWGRKQTIFHDPKAVPIIFQLNAVLIASNPLVTQNYMQLPTPAQTPSTD